VNAPGHAKATGVEEEQKEEDSEHFRAEQQLLTEGRQDLQVLILRR
jgi:hypothetical protein